MVTKKRRVLWAIAVLTLLLSLFGTIGYATQSAPSDGSAAYASTTSQEKPGPSPKLYCWTEYYRETGPWFFLKIDTYRCNHTWQCNFFIDKGCYAIEIWQRIVYEWSRQCCEEGGIPWCGPWSGPRVYTQETERHQFLYCYCHGASASGCY